MKDTSFFFPVIILRFPRLSTPVKPRKHKSNKLAALVYRDASVITRQRFFLSTDRLLGKDGKFTFAVKSSGVIILLEFQPSFGVLTTSRLTGVDPGQPANLSANIMHLSALRLVRNTYVQI